MDEVDLEYYLAHRSAATARPDRGPSILVEPAPDGATERDCEKYGLKLFAGNAVEFCAFLDKHIPNRPSPLDLVPAPTQNLFPPGTSKRIIVPFAADFEVVPSQAIANNSASRFHFGHPPDWGDLAGNQDIGRVITGKVSPAVDEFLAGDERIRIFLLIDDTGTGKTTVLRRVSFDLARKNVKVLMCSALSRIDPARTAEAIDLIDEPVLLVVDNFADQATPISEALLRLRHEKVGLLGAERRYRMPYIKRALSQFERVTFSGSALTYLEAENLLKLNINLGLVGRPEATKNPNAFAKQLLGEPIAVASCRILNDFRPLDRIVKSVIADASPVDRQRYLIAALAHFCISGGVRYEVLSSIVGRDGWDNQFETSHPLPLAYFDDREKNYVVPLNGTLADQVLTEIGRTVPNAMLDAFTALANEIAPRVNRNAVRRRTPEARLAGRLFDFDQVTSGFLKDRAPRFYTAAHAGWQWNSRYWEQVALMHLAEFRADPSSQQGKDALEQAVQHARHAVAIETHPLSLTTLGKILIAQLSDDSASRSATYDEAFSRFSAAIELERSWSPPTVLPFVGLFRGTREFVALGGQLTNKQRERLRSFVSEAESLFPREAEVSEAIAAITDLT